jgi:hypothetical protein
MATFMARWSTDWPGSGGHIHLSLVHAADGKPVFHDAGAQHGISETMRHFIGGQQRHMPELAALAAPTVNSFRRLVPGFWAPTNATCGVDNRTCALRVIPGGPSAQRVEFRIAAADANPYLALAAAVASGLRGIEQRIEPEPLVQGTGGLHPLRLTLEGDQSGRSGAGGPLRAGQVRRRDADVGTHLQDARCLSGSHQPVQKQRLAAALAGGRRPADGERRRVAARVAGQARPLGFDSGRPVARLGLDVVDVLSPHPEHLAGQRVPGSPQPHQPGAFRHPAPAVAPDGARAARGVDHPLHDQPGLHAVRTLLGPDRRVKWAVNRARRRPGEGGGRVAGMRCPGGGGPLELV